MTRYVRALLAITFLALFPAAHAQGDGSDASGRLSYQVSEGQNLNAFLREGNVAAHLLLRSGRDPRIVVAFPAGNSGVGLWFERVPCEVSWRLEGAPEPITLADRAGRPLYGIVARVTVAAPRLAVRQAVLSNVRFLRDYQAVGTFPTEVVAPMRRRGRTFSFSRDRLDGAPGYLLTVTVVRGRLTRTGIVADGDGEIGLEIRAASGDRPLTPLDERDLLNDRAAPDQSARDTLSFLSYREKFLAGSWRFNTYFGRDTLMSLRLLMPALQPDAVEAGLGSVLSRLAPTGEVAHEEGLSEFALVERQRHSEPGGDAATLDYGMIDDDFMLAPVMASYLLDTADGRARAGAFLDQRFAPESNPRSSVSAGAMLVANLRFVIAQARPFAANPEATSLVSIKPGRMSGNWRDSDEGLGRGRFAYDVNAVFVPAALAAADRLFRAGMLDPYLTSADRAALGEAGRMASVWRRRAPPLFTVSLPSAEARAAVARYAEQLRVPADAALASVGQRPLTFHALSLDEHGVPIPILHSDEGFALLFGAPPPEYVDMAVAATMRPFPAGLMTDIGLLVANPVFADGDAQARFTRNHYHGAVVWSWQQAMLAAGYERQLARTDLPAGTRRRLVEAQTALWRAIAESRVVRSSELWSWNYQDGRYRVAPFGASSADVDESNAAQLWSTVYLSVQPPR
ncbi:MAG: hypothetical protein A4S17_00665 [Proteobacteria bacterium HN_bin10]|nr:MAG: hypothetical protein A4S17_00665 [Proteobacteria bacterium HN_bin10]